MKLLFKLLLLFYSRNKLQAIFDDACFGDGYTEYFKKQFREITLSKTPLPESTFEMYKYSPLWRELKGVNDRRKKQ